MRDGPEARRQETRARERADRAERMLRAVIGQAEARDGVGETEKLISDAEYRHSEVSTGEIRLWWAEHKRAEVERQRALERLRRREQHCSEGLAKLTPEERVALGLA